MIKISDNFKTDDKKLAALYADARSLLLSSETLFGDYRLTAKGPEKAKLTAATEIMTAETVARYNIESAFDCINAFLMTSREDGRIAGEIVKKQDEIFCDYSRLAGFCIAEEALSVFYMAKKKELAFLDKLYDGLKKFDSYIWSTHDCNGNKLVELFGERELAEGVNSARYAPITTNDGGRISEISPYPVETALMSAFCYRLKRTLYLIATLIKNGEADRYLADADRLFSSFKTSFWIEEAGACYDRDYRGSMISYVGMENLFMMYYGAFDREMAESFVERHVMNPDEFFTRLPLPEISADLGGTVCGTVYRRMIRALERYGFYSQLTALSVMALDGLFEAGTLSEQYDPGTCETIKSGNCEGFAPTASAVVEMIARLYGVSVDFDDVVWGCLGHKGENTSEYSFTWGGDTYSLFAEQETGTGYINGKLLFSVTNGVRVTTDWFGNLPRVTNISDKTLDIVFVYRDHTYSFTLEPNGTWEQ